MHYRHEWKHEINCSDRLVLISRLSAVMRPDPHAIDGKYQSRSLYFDNLNDKALREKIDGVNMREKFRIRFYNGDSYTGSMIHNYYLHESDGKLGMIPWDYNLAFGTFQGGNASGSVNASIDSPVSGSLDDRPMVGWIFSDESYTAQYHELFSEFLEKWFTNGELETLIEDTAEMIRPYVEKDPTKFCTTEEFENGVSALSQFVSLRAQAVRSQLAGDGTAVDTGDLNLSDMGSMGGGRSIPGMSRDDKAAAAEEPVSGSAEEGTDRPDSFSFIGQFPGASGPDGEQVSGSDAAEGGAVRPDGFPSDGQFPDMPDSGTGGTSFSGSGGSGADGENPARSQDAVPEEQSDNAERGKSGSRPQFSGSGGSFDPMSLTSGKNSKTSSWLLVGVSVFALALGLVVAIKKKY